MLSLSLYLFLSLSLSLSLSLYFSLSPLAPPLAQPAARQSRRPNQLAALLESLGVSRKKQSLVLRTVYILNEWRLTFFKLLTLKQEKSVFEQ
jgi:hypothetical protein